MKPRRPEPPATLSLAQRIAEDLAMTGGRMPIVIIVDDEKERTEAQRLLAGKKHARLITLKMRAEGEKGR